MKATVWVHRDDVGWTVTHSFEDDSQGGDTFEACSDRGAALKEGRARAQFLLAHEPRITEVDLRIWKVRDLKQETVAVYRR